MRYIADLREGDNITGIYFCKVKHELKTKTDKLYYSITLQDKTGTLDAKVWDVNSNGIEEFEGMDFVYIAGQVTRFQSALQLNISRARKCEEGEYNPADYMPMSSKNIEEMYDALLDFIKKIKEEHLRKLVESFFVEDFEFVKAFKGHSAAKNVHHSFIGGLLEHTLGVVQLSNKLADFYPVINRDLLLTAALFHDIGKLEELSVFPENDYTNEGQLLGHIYIGAERIGERIKEFPDFPDALSLELRHCILSHHGELEFGSPKKPALIEAVALNLADNVDAKMETLKEAFESSDGKTEWLGYNRLFESNLKRTMLE